MSEQLGLYKKTCRTYWQVATILPISFKLEKTLLLYWTKQGRETQPNTTLGSRPRFTAVQQIFEHLLHVLRIITLVKPRLDFLKVVSKYRTPMWSSNSISECLSEGNQNTNPERYMYPHVHYSIIYNSQVSTSGWMDKENLVCVYMCVYVYIYYSTITKKKILPLAMWMASWGLMLNKISKR